MYILIFIDKLTAYLKNHFFFHLRCIVIHWMLLVKCGIAMSEWNDGWKKMETVKWNACYHNRSTENVNCVYWFTISSFTLCVCCSCRVHSNRMGPTITTQMAHKIKVKEKQKNGPVSHYRAPFNSSGRVVRSIRYWNRRWKRMNEREREKLNCIIIVLCVFYFIIIIFVS